MCGADPAGRDRCGGGLVCLGDHRQFLDHLPLYRLQQIAQRQEVALSRSTLPEWVGRIGAALQPLADRLALWLRGRSVLHADETPARQLDPGAGKTKRAYLWAYRARSYGKPSPARLAALHAWLIATRLNVAAGTGTANALDNLSSLLPPVKNHAS